MRARPLFACSRHRILVVGILWSIVGLVVSGSYAADDIDSAPLRGQPGVRVLIESFDPEIDRGGAIKQQLRTDVELRLRQAGVRVFTENEWMQGIPQLYVNVNVILTADARGAAYNTRVAVDQNAHLVASASEIQVTTWQRESIGITDRATMATRIRNSVRDLVDAFITAYLSVNPRPAGSTPPSSASPRRDLIRQVQQRLQAVGFNPGSMDGALGPQTREALRWFQNTKGLPPTGEPDEATLDALSIR
jgi:Putative peptidoglycan binding domain